MIRFQYSDKANRFLVLIHVRAAQVRYLDLPDRQDLRKLQQLREEQGELSAADERRLRTLQVRPPVDLVSRFRCWPVTYG